MWEALLPLNQLKTKTKVFEQQGLPGYLGKKLREKSVGWKLQQYNDI